MPEPEPDPDPTPTPDPVVSERVLTTDNLNVRNDPNGIKLGMQRKGAWGSADTSTRVNGENYTWVYVDFDSAPDGYVAEEFLT